MDYTDLEQNSRYVFYVLWVGLFAYFFIFLPYTYKLAYRSVNSDAPGYIVRLTSIILGALLSTFIIAYFGLDVFERYYTQVNDMYRSFVASVENVKEIYRAMVLLVYTVLVLPAVVNVLSMTIICTLFRFGIGIHRHLGASVIFHIIHLIIVPMLLIFIFYIIGFELLINASSTLHGNLELSEEILPALENLDQFEGN
tara:strand:- start:47 stop:640 length:594 start_codon:yes stop_codon:yes gene_type:complete